MLEDPLPRWYTHIAVGRRFQSSPHGALHKLAECPHHMVAGLSPDRKSVKECVDIFQSTTVSNAGWRFYQLFPAPSLHTRPARLLMSLLLCMGHMSHESKFQKQEWLVSGMARMVTQKNQEE